MDGPFVFFVSATSNVSITEQLGEQSIKTVGSTEALDGAFDNKPNGARRTSTLRRLNTVLSA